MQKALLTSIVVLFGLGGRSRPSSAHPKDEAGLGKCDAVRLTARCAARPDVGFDGLSTGETLRPYRIRIPITLTANTTIHTITDTTTPPICRCGNFSCCRTIRDVRRLRGDGLSLGWPRERAYGRGDGLAKRR